MSDYRDPKVTTPTTQKTGSARSGAGRWIGILAAVVLLILVIAWLWGGYGTGDVEVAEPGAPVIEGTEPVEPVAPAAPVQQ